ncbi:MAG: tautomerase family protein [Pseudomonadota bacterium]
MPLARLAGISGYLSDSQKKELIGKVTDAILSVEGEGLRPVTWVLIEDVPEGQWGVGGEIATAQLLRGMRDGGGA